MSQAMDVSSGISGGTDVVFSNSAMALAAQDGQFSKNNFTNAEISSNNSNVSSSYFDTTVNKEMPTILCCLCGTRIQSNPANMCLNCLKSQVDITEGISKQIVLFFCRNCGRYQRPPWVSLELESKEMLALCLKKIKGLNKDVKLIDAAFVWTEPHSRRIKVKITIQKEVFHHAILQQSFVVEFIVTGMQCTDCQRSFTEHTWKSCVQVRQKVKHKRTFYLLEQLLIKHNVCDKVLEIKEITGGLDFFWLSRSGASALLDFLRAVVPIRSKASKKLISQDDNSNDYNYKYTLYAEIAPICKDDLCVLDKQLAQQLGGHSPLMLCQRVTSVITLLDPISMKVVEVSGGTYWHHPFQSIMNSKQLIEFTVIDITVIDSATTEQQHGTVDLRAFNKQSLHLNNTMQLATVTVARTSDFGNNDTYFECVTHLGNRLKAGDSCLGYDLTNANVTADLDDDDSTKSTKSNSRISHNNNKRRQLPDVILVRKFYPLAKSRQRQRKFELRQLKKAEAERTQRKSEMASDDADYEAFQQEIEEDPELRAKINIYKKRGAAGGQLVVGGVAADGSSRDVSMAVATAGSDMNGSDDDDSDGDDDDVPAIDVNELLDGLEAIQLSEAAKHRHTELDAAAYESEADDPAYTLVTDDSEMGFEDGKGGGAGGAAGAAGAKRKGRK